MIKKQYLGILILIIAVIAVITAGFQFGIFNFEAQKETAKQPTTEPLLWIIEGDNPSYLYGSIHVGTKEIVTLPDVVMNALDEIDVVYTEIKLDDATTYQTNLFLLLDGESLEDILTEDLANKLDAYLKTKGYSLTMFNPLKIWAIAVSLIQLEYPGYFLNYAGGLDKYIWDLADSKGKETYGLETAYEQLIIFDNLTHEEQNQLLSDTLNEVTKTSKDPFKEIIDAYLQADLEAYLNAEYQKYDTSDPLYQKLLKELLENRNHRMTERIIANITKNSDKQFFFTIGSAHFYGDNNIITLLEDQGYTVTRVPFEECPSCICSPGQEKINNRCYIPYSPP